MVAKRLSLAILELSLKGFNINSQSNCLIKDKHFYCRCLQKHAIFAIVANSKLISIKIRDKNFNSKFLLKFVIFAILCRK